MSEKAKQLYLPIEWTTNYSSESFLRDAGNEQAYRWIHMWPEKCQEISISCICGPKSSGKTHLMRIWQEKHNAFLINTKEPTFNIVQKNKFLILPHMDEIADHEWLFHLYNSIVQNQCYLLTTAYTLPHTWSAQTKDLESRFKVIFPVEIRMHEQPDLFLEQMLRNRGLMLSSFQKNYLLKRIEMSHNSLYLLAAKVDLIQKTKGKVKFKDIMSLCH